MTNKTFAALLGGAALVVLAACAQPAPAPAPVEPTPAPAAEPAPAPAPVLPATVVEIAAGNADFSTLVAAVQAAGLVETLSGPGPFTVFAPTNAAFAALPAGTVENLLKPENIEQLKAVLTYHVVPGKVLSSALAGTTSTPATVNGATVTVDGTAGVKVNGANVVTADLEAGNGVVHVIDAVILPPAQ
jgi:uncharacterized surface protein with fasciclin (FAS1) repeats